MPRSCLNCPARMSDGSCRFDGCRHTDPETCATADCPIDKPLHKFTVLDMLESLKVFCTRSSELKCISCPFYGTSFCEKFLPVVDTYTLDVCIKEFTEELPF